MNEMHISRRDLLKLAALGVGLLGFSKAGWTERSPYTLSRVVNGTFDLSAIHVGPAAYSSNDLPKGTTLLKGILKFGSVAGSHSFTVDDGHGNSLKIDLSLAAESSAFAFSNAAKPIPYDNNWSVEYFDNRPLPKWKGDPRTENRIPVWNVKHGSGVLRPNTGRVYWLAGDWTGNGTGLADDANHNAHNGCPIIMSFDPADPKAWRLEQHAWLPKRAVLQASGADQSQNTWDTDTDQMVCHPVNANGFHYAFMLTPSGIKPYDKLARGEAVVPLYVNATTFKVSGDHRAQLQVDRKIRIFANHRDFPGHDIYVSGGALRRPCHFDVRIQSVTFDGTHTSVQFQRRPFDPGKFTFDRNGQAIGFQAANETLDETTTKGAWIDNAEWYWDEETHQCVVGLLWWNPETRIWSRRNFRVVDDVKRVTANGAVSSAGYSQPLWQFHTSGIGHCTMHFVPASVTGRNAEIHAVVTYYGWPAVHVYDLGANTMTAYVMDQGIQGVGAPETAIWKHQTAYDPARKRIWSYDVTNRTIWYEDLVKRRWFMALPANSMSFVPQAPSDIGGCVYNAELDVIEIHTLLHDGNYAASKDLSRNVVVVDPNTLEVFNIGNLNPDGSQIRGNSFARGNGKTFLFGYQFERVEDGGPGYPNYMTVIQLVRQTRPAREGTPVPAGRRKARAELVQHASRQRYGGSEARTSAVAANDIAATRAWNSGQAQRLGTMRGIHRRVYSPTVQGAGYLHFWGGAHHAYGCMDLERVLLAGLVAQTASVVTDQVFKPLLPETEYAVPFASSAWDGNGGMPITFWYEGAPRSEQGDRTTVWGPTDPKDSTKFWLLPPHVWGRGTFIPGYGYVTCQIAPHGKNRDGTWQVTPTRARLVALKETGAAELLPNPSDLCIFGSGRDVNQYDGGGGFQMSDWDDEQECLIIFTEVAKYAPWFTSIYEWTARAGLVRKENPLHQTEFSFRGQYHYPAITRSSGNTNQVPVVFGGNGNHFVANSIRDPSAYDKPGLATALNCYHHDRRNPQNNRVHRIPMPPCNWPGHVGPVDLLNDIYMLACDRESRTLYFAHPENFVYPSADRPYSAAPKIVIWKTTYSKDGSTISGWGRVDYDEDTLRLWHWDYNPMKYHDGWLIFIVNYNTFYRVRVS